MLKSEILDIRKSDKLNILFKRIVKFSGWIIAIDIFFYLVIFLPITSILFLTGFLFLVVYIFPVQEKERTNFNSIIDVLIVLVDLISNPALTVSSHGIIYSINSIMIKTFNLDSSMKIDQRISDLFIKNQDIIQLLSNFDNNDNEIIYNNCTYQIQRSIVSTLYKSEILYLIIFSDITENKNISQNLIENNSIFKSESELNQIIMQLICDHIFIISSEGTLMYVNSPSDCFIDISLRDNIGNNLWSFLPSEMKNKIKKSVDQVVQINSPVHVFEHFIRYGLERWIDMYYAPISLGYEKKGIICFSRNITEIKQKETKEISNNIKNAIVGTEQMCLLSYMNSPNPVIFLRKGKISDWNKTAEKVFNLNEEKYKDRDPSILSSNKQFHSFNVPEQFTYYVSKAIGGSVEEFFWVLSSIYGEISANITLVPQFFKMTHLYSYLFDLFLLFLIRLNRLIQGFNQF